MEETIEPGNYPPVRMLHMSDLHIGNDYYASEALIGFERGLALGLENQTDILLIAGDLFDNDRIERVVIERVWALLADFRRPTVVLPGNHDTTLLKESSLRNVPPSVKVIQNRIGEFVTLERNRVSIWGKPVYEHIPSFRPMSGIPDRPRNNWYVVMAHGLYMDTPDPMRSSPISPEEIGNASCDYIALGHVHVFRDVSNNCIPAYYSGAPSGSQENTIAIVNLDKSNGVSVCPVSVVL